MITKEDLVNRHEERVKQSSQKNSRYGSLPVSLFHKDESFNEDNWNGGEAVIRQYVGYLEWEVDGNKESKEFSIENEDKNSGIDGRFVSTTSWNEDYNYIQIVTHHYRWDKDDSSDWKVDQYLIMFYKSRGRTDKIIKNGRLITFDEYVELLNIIEATGYKFQ